MTIFTFTAYKIESFGFGKSHAIIYPKFYSRFIFNLAKVLFDYLSCRRRRCISLADLPDQHAQSVTYPQEHSRATAITNKGYLRSEG